MKSNTLRKVSLLSVSLFLMSHLAIAPSIPKLYDFYNQQATISLAQIETLVTIPALFITIFILISNLFVSSLGKKKNHFIRIKSYWFLWFITNDKHSLYCGFYK
ncbi:hypothetical protein HMPREF9318_00596 [Streptococcus urinalis FB127-CNA-2]|nr:hypothetical protein HMPREF9318_00596 [Streptococcus urinalis FB127-CNA-2]VEF32211.1 major facilitator family protein [Streptococcus urinalis]